MSESSNGLLVIGGLRAILPTLKARQNQNPKPKLYPDNERRNAMGGAWEIDVVANWRKRRRERIDLCT
jgi:hypothetical protein